ncbi:MAG: rane protein, partial [Verrucomicrobiales bacterium]|nr:rane protein [Verrucomicrobiales bacterium]
ALVLPACNKPAPPAGAGGPSGPMPVMTMQAEARKVSDWDEFSARIEATDSVEIRPRVTGYIDRVAFEAGQMVKEGDVLFEIDPRFEQASLDVADAAVAQAKARLLSSQSEADRVESLLKARAISSEDADTRLNALAVAKAAVKSAEASRNGAILNMEFTKVRSPINGRVSRALQTRGNYISGVAGFTTLLTSVVSVDPMHVYASVDDSTFQRYRRLIREKKLSNPEFDKVPVELKMEGDTEWTHKGWVESYDNRIDPATGSITVRAVFPNKDGILVAGSFARMRVPGSAQYDALLVDEKYIGTNQDVKYLMVVGKDSTAELRPVQLGRSFEGQRLVLSGITPEDKIIISSLQILQPGAPVQPLPPAAAAAPKPVAAK